MKRIYFLLSAIILTGSLFCSCDRNDPNQPKPTADKPNWVEIPQPESSTSMTIICIPPLNEQMAADDELAAFMNDQCCRVARQQDGLFYLGVPGLEHEQEMELRYYSATKQSIRVLRTIYVPNGRMGTSDAPYRLVF